MDVSLDLLSPECSTLDLKGSNFKSSPSLLSLCSDSSTSSGLVCPSLGSSSTLSSNDFSELETDLDSDDISPISSPFVGTAYDLTCSLTSSVSDLEVGDNAPPSDIATPRPLRVERGSYFRRPKRAVEKWIMDGEGVEGIPNGKRSAKSILGFLKSNKVDACRRSGVIRTTGDKITSENLARPNQNDQGTLHSEKPTDGKAHILEGDSGTKDSILALPRMTTKGRYADIGIGLPSTWHGEPTPRADSASVEDSSSFSLPSGPLDTITDQMQDDPPQSCKKVTLVPIDSLLMFVQTPSPIESLPPSILFADNSMGAHEGIRSLPSNQNGPDSSVASVGLGIQIELGDESAGLTKGCS